MRYRRGILVALAAAAATVTMLSFLSTGAPASSEPAHAAAHNRLFTGQVTSSITNEGQTQGQAVNGVVARGSFAAKLSPAAAIAVRLLEAATGVPYADLAKGGSFVARYSVDANGKGTGLFVAKFNARGLGTACFSYTADPGQFKPGDTFVPVSGSFRFVGGTKRAARLRGSGSLDQTDISGTNTETIGGKGSASLSVNHKAKKPSAACKSVR